MKQLTLLYVILHCLVSNGYTQLTLGSQMDSFSIRREVSSVTAVMFHDVIDPPAAARFYAYSVITGYEIMAILEKGNSLLFRNQLTGSLYALKMPAEINIRFAALYGILETAKTILPSGYLLEEEQEALKREGQKRLSSNIMQGSIDLALQVSNRIVQQARSDGYFKLSTLQRYKPFTNEENWQATPPEYMAAVQPHWNTIRPFFMDSASEYRPNAVAPFSKDSNSMFYRMAFAVYKTGRSLDSNQQLIASFWDCNPFAVQFAGHMSVGLKKISPGGHWMGIVGAVCQQRKLSFEQTLFLHAVLAMTLHDAFISCWEEKYRSSRIRPETFINRYIDEKWQPYLQTPPFPECTSGHTVISTAAAVVLSEYLGNKCSFIDSTEMYIGLPPRAFSSFSAAAEEAGVSRFYGGIHFWDSITTGKDQGTAVGKRALSELKKKKWIGQ